MFGAISEKFRTFDMQIDFAIPPISHFRRWLGEFFSLFQSYEISITLSISSLGKSKTFFGISRQSLIIKKHVQFTRLRDFYSFGHICCNPLNKLAHYLFSIRLTAKRNSISVILSLYTILYFHLFRNKSMDLL